MPSVTIKFDADNAAFAEDAFSEECARILESAALRIRDGELDGVLRDMNGNTVGTFSVEPPELDEPSPGI